MRKKTIEKNQNIRIAVAMSGGVDSSVAGALLAEQYGQENVFGVTMRLFCYADKSTNPKNCCSLEAINDAKAVCKKIGIKHYVIDFEKEFGREVIDNFVNEYLSGKTPNPCVRCNSIIKFDYLLEKVGGLDADYLATGHYACIQPTANSKQQTTFKLLKGKDEKKDQSYFLYGMIQEQLAHTLFPLGDYKKEEVRKMAKRYDLKTAEKVESQEICFIQDTDYREFLKSRIDTKKEEHHELIRRGDIVDKDGNVLGRHEGISFYTIGQRRGIGIARKDPYYVTGFDMEKNQLIVGDEKDLYKKELELEDISWTSGKAPLGDFKAEVMIRYNMKPEKAKLVLEGGNVKIVFDKPQKSITPGQSAVIYTKDVVLGGGIIKITCS